MQGKLHTFQYGIWTYVTREPPSLVHGLLFKPWTGLAQLWALIFVNEKSAKVSQSKLVFFWRGYTFFDRPAEAPKPRSGPISALVIFVKEAYFLGPFYFLIIVALNVLLAICKAFQTFFWSQIIDSVSSVILQGFGLVSRSGHQITWHLQSQEVGSENPQQLCKPYKAESCLMSPRRTSRVWSEDSGSTSLVRNSNWL